MTEEEKSVHAHGGRFGYGVVETTLMLTIIAILFFTAWFVHWSTDKTGSIINSTNMVAGSSANAPTPSTTGITTYAACKDAPGSIIEQTYPEICTTSGGKSFTDTSESVSQ